MRVVLLGPPGSGKGTHGKRLAASLGVPLIELAALVNQITGGTTGDLLEQIVQAVQNAGNGALNPLPNTSKGTIVTVQSSTGTGAGTTPPCGLLGIESLLGVTGLGLIRLSRKRGM